jgi:hypothetical protein
VVFIAVRCSYKVQYYKGGVVFIAVRCSYNVSRNFICLKFKGADARQKIGSLLFFMGKCVKNRENGGEGGNMTPLFSYSYE